MSYEEDPAQVADEFEQDERFESDDLHQGFIRRLLVIATAVSLLILVFTDRVVLRDEAFMEIRFFASILAALLAWAAVFWGAQGIVHWLEKPIGR